MLLYEVGAETPVVPVSGVSVPLGDGGMAHVLGKVSLVLKLEAQCHPRQILLLLQD